LSHAEKGRVVTQLELCEVGPRDGLQNESEILSVEFKLQLIQRIIDAGLRRIEVTSFVSPKWIPQLADADELVERLPSVEGVRYAALVPNVPGWERFRASGRLHDASLFISVSETHNQKNVNKPVAAHLERLRAVIERAKDDGVPTRVYVSTSFGCPYEGDVDPQAVIALALQLFSAGVSEIAISDTIGVGVPRQVKALIAALREEMPVESLVLHFHDTYGRALANAMAGYEAGVRKFDSSLGGLGGCPYAPGASGNLASEDLVSLFEGEGVETGVDLDELTAASAWLEREVMGRPLPSRVLRARLGAR
jgi:hydroxymethylglutaryl-CoA lyase